MADEILKQKLQQISDNDTQIGTTDLEIKGQVNALRQYGMGATGIQRDRLGDVVYDLVDGYGKGGGGIVTGQFTLASKAAGVTITHNAGFSEYVLIATQTEESLETLKASSDTSRWAYDFVLVCTMRFPNLIPVTNFTRNLNKIAAHHDINPGGKLLSTTLTDGGVDTFNANMVKTGSSWGVHAGTYNYIVIKIS